MVSADLVNQLKLEPNQSLTLQAGTGRAKVQFSGTPDVFRTASILVDEVTARQLMLPLPITINLAVNQKRWRLGPLIGIFANRFEKLYKPFGEQSSFFRKLGAAAQHLHAFCFAFGPDDIDWEKRTICGSVPPTGDGLTEWPTMVLPLPDVVYDRGLFPKGEKRKAATAARKVLRSHPDLKMFNPAFFGKWKTHLLLSRNQALAEHLPETRLFTSMAADVYPMLLRHGSVYLKPSGGSSGRGIIVISARPQGFTLKFRASRRLFAIDCPDQASLDKGVADLLKPQKYIVQQAIKLAKYRGNPFDIRVLMQRNKSGFWLRTGMATRVAGQGSFVTNIHAGGHAERIAGVLAKTFTGEQAAPKLMNRIRNVCSLTAAVVSIEASPFFGEIAVDLGVDETGKVWIIELNAIPGRSVFRRVGLANVSARAIARPMEYACYLAGFAPHKDEK